MKHCRKLWGKKQIYRTSFSRKKSFCINKSSNKDPKFQFMSSYQNIGVLKFSPKENRSSSKDLMRAREKSDRNPIRVSISHSIKWMTTLIELIPIIFYNRLFRTAFRNSLGNFAGKGVGGKIFDCLF
jgi:hypothetical protein